MSVPLPDSHNEDTELVWPWDQRASWLRAISESGRTEKSDTLLQLKNRRFAFVSILK